MTRRARLAVAGGAALLLLVVVLPGAVGLLADWYWFQSLGFQQVFLTELGLEAALAIGAAALGGGFLYLNLRFAQRDQAVLLHVARGVVRPDLTRSLRRFSLPAALALALPIGLAAPSAWLGVLRFVHRTRFGAVDPVFGRDVGYYVFTLPLLEAVTGLILSVLVVTLLAVGTLYVLRGDVVVIRRRVMVEPSGERHLSVLGAAVFLILGLEIALVDLPHLVYSTTGPLVGASYADLHARAPALRVAALAAVVGAGLVGWGGFTRRLARHATIAVAAYGAARVGGWLVPAALQRLSVLPNELARETPQIEHHIFATRRAWALDRVEVRDLSGEATLARSDVERNAATIRNVRLWDRDPLLQTFGQLQEIRTYYDFVSVDNDRYRVSGEYRQVMLSPRELNSAALPTRTFINERLTFTHGMGLTLGPVNRVTAEGLPVLLIKDLPPASLVELRVTRPQIYFGELSNDWVFVNTRQAEFDYPAADANVTTRYEGSGGVPVRSLLRRAVLAARFQSLKVLLSQDITTQSRALYHRRVEERARKALPFLAWDGDPYLVIAADGRLKWILDAYTVTERYPYAQPIADGVNYMRNAVKVVVDAYDGTVVPYLVDPDDPLIQTYAKAFPGLFVTLSEMPSDLRGHLRYPEDLFRLQTLLYATYHMGEADEFYHREDQWQIPVVERPGARDPFLRHIVMKLPGGEREEFILMTPFTPRQKDNLAAWMVARNDGEHYGELLVYRFPRQSLVFGPRQVVNRMNQDTEIARQVTLWDQRGSEVIRGNLLVIPIEESLIYVQPIYLRAEGGQIPELKRVIVAYQNRVVMEETLEQGLARLFDGAVAPAAPEARVAVDPGPPGAADRVSNLVAQAAEHYGRALAAQRAGDWAGYGDEIRRLGEVLAQLRQAVGGDRQ